MVASTVIAVRAVQTTASFLMTLSFGAFCANYPSRPKQYITSEGLAVISKITMNLLSPILVFVTMAEGVSLEVMKDVGILIGWSGVNVILCTFIALPLTYIFKVPANFKYEFLFGISFPNALAAPVVMMETLCRQQPLVDEIYGEEGTITCVDRALTWIMIYTAGWIFMFFGVVYPVLMPSEGDTDGTTTTTGGGDERGWRSKVWSAMGQVINGNIIATVLGTTTDLTEMFDGGLLWFSSSMTTLGTPIVGLSALIVGATLGQTLHRLATTSAFCAKYCCQSCTAADDDVSTGDDDKSGAVSSDGDRSSKRDQEKGEGDADDDKLPSFWIITLFVLTRIVICPAVCCALVWGVGDRVITSSDPADAQLIKLVLILEAIVPSADFVIVS
eukprot:gene8754-20663_t